MPGDPVAIVGMAVLLPAAGDLDSYWRNLVEGVDAVTETPPHRWDPEFYDPARAHRPDRLYCRRGGFVDDLATFDPLRFGIMPASVAEIEPDQLIALNVAAAAVEDAGGMDRLPAGERVGVILGRGGILSPAQARYAQRVRMSSQVIQVLRELIPDLPESRLDAVRARFDERLGKHQPEGTIGLVPNLAASRVANRLNLRGPAYTVDAACASSLIAVDQAVTELNSGRLDAVLAGGVHHVHDISFWSVFSQLGALSRQGEIRPFDSAADGLLIGEGTGVVVLKRMADAVRDGDRTYAVIRGSGMSSDGRAASMVNPASAGQVLAVRQAWAAAELDPTAPDALGLLEAHGTATPTGDAVELATLAEVFGPHRGGARPVIGSVKSMIGHAMPAAGIASLIKAALAVHRGVLLPTLHCDTPRPELGRTRFAPITTAQPWESDGPRRAGVNAFGFGGSNAHVVLEETPEAFADRRGGTGSAGPVTRPVPVPAAELVGRGEAGGQATVRVTVEQPDEVLWLAAPEPAALARLLDTDDHNVRILGAARARQASPTGVRPLAAGEHCRLGIVSPDPKRLGTARRAVARGQSWRGARDIWFSPTPLLADDSGGQLAFVYPGLDAEFSPRTADIAAHFGLPDRQWSADDLGRHGAGVIEVGRLLNDALHRIGITPHAVAGHSIGEWTAAATTGQISSGSIDDFLAAFNSTSIEVPGRAFAVIGGAAEQVTPRLAGYPGVALSHDNAPAQCIVNGPEGEIELLVEALRDDGLLCQKLPFRSAFHTPMFASGLESIGAALRRWQVRPTRVPVWSTTLRAPFPTEPARVLEIFIRHMLEPVWFRQTVQAMYDSGVRVFLQVGAGQLASVIGDNLRGRDHLAMPVNVTHRSGLDQLRRVATALWVEGAAPDLRALAPPTGRTRITAPTTVRSARRGPTVRLDLGGPLVRLGEGADGLLGVSVHLAPGGSPDDTGGAGATSSPIGVPGRPGSAVEGGMVPVPAQGFMAAQDSVPAQGCTTAQDSVPAQGCTTAQADAALPGSPALATLHRLAGHSSAAAELAMLLSDTSAVAATDGGTGQPARTPPPRPYRTVLRVALDTMPYLRDHCFFVQPDDWPDAEDRWPVVPATTVVQHMVDAAEQAAPGTRVVGVRAARFTRWLIAAPPQDVEITVQPVGPGRLEVILNGYARATVEVAPDYPADRPAVWRYDPATERPPRLHAEEMYAERLMFHGPLFRGVTKVHALGDMHIRGVVTAPAPPGALLDNALQLVGNWLITTQPVRTVALPMEFGHVRFFGPSAAPGTAFECVARVRAIDNRQLVADTQLSVDGRVWAQIEGCVDRRFDSHPTARPAERFPERHPMSLRQPEGWTMAFDCWTDLVTRAMAARGILGTSGYADYERQPPKARKHWLLGRIAVKDAVRFQQWEDGHTDVYPIELTVTNEPNGRPRVRLRPGRGFRDCDVSLAHTAEIGVAIAKPRQPDAPPGAPGVGIDVAEIADQPDGTVTAALSGPERRLLDSVATGEEPCPWLARFRVAKEAAAKAEGTGITGDPRRFAVVGASPSALTVEVGDRVYQVAYRDVANPEDLPARRYVVGWTWGPEPAHRTGRP
ncbi:polyketide synthase [Plantactinospora sp. KLBMP9567]|uniref:polyketide synthase n=1 Tax=Plantactinospora sp. KLBMP9567 TaxID=3085900 RepID=UPI0029828AEA|nr:polyketide synthase [Plantactinospora sp. KLBMP9567]MDW5326947.1 beta-ketoacyl synthase N-terminal-like domain-containing protein [Plantactinospora sp. KLBMP9567]